MDEGRTGGNPLTASADVALLLSALTTAAFLLSAASFRPAAAQSLRGSGQSLSIQNRMARDHDFTFLSSPAQLRSFAQRGLIVRLEGDGNYRVHNVSFPYARPEVRTFVERLSRQYRDACGEPLVVTSLTRPQSRQPYNASSRSVHPTGMAIDLRRSNRATCRNWLESVLIYLEEQGIVEATRESRPPHYHVAVFPQPYVRYVAGLSGAEETATGRVEYQVRRGDTLWEIARSMGVSMVRLREVNGLSSDRIQPGQLLRIPVEGEPGNTSSSVSYQVRSGDSLWTIARSHSTTVERIRLANGLSSDRIRPGQVLTVPREQ